MTREFTADDIEEGVYRAIAARDFQAAVDLMTALVSVDMPRGIALYDAVTGALDAMKTLRAAGVTDAEIQNLFTREAIAARILAKAGLTTEAEHG